MRLLPGKTFNGPITPKGNIPVYKENGAFSIYHYDGCILCCIFWLEFIFCDHSVRQFGSLLGALNLFSLIFCVFLYLKGRFFPSSTDSGISNNILFDYYWGTEFYPQVFGWSIKKFITCRFGMMSWGLFLISYCAKQTELSGFSNSMFISVVITILYISEILSLGKRLFTLTGYHA